MGELLSNPAMQAAGAPFVVALVLALLLRRFLPQWTGLAVLAGFFVAVQLTTGGTLWPLNSTRKIILCGLALPVLMFVLDRALSGLSRRWLRWAIPALLLSAAVLWIVWPVLQRQQGPAIGLMAVPLVVFVMATLFAAQGLTRQAFSAQAASTVVFAVGTGVTALIAASALYSQLAFAVAAAVGALIVPGLFVSSAKPARLGLLTLYAVVVPVSLIAAAATVYAQLPLLVLFGLALVPVFVGFAGRMSRTNPLFNAVFNPTQQWLAVISTSLWGSLPVLPAIWLVWSVAGPVSF